MEFPFGHHDHHHHRGDDDSERNRLPPQFAPTGEVPEGFYPASGHVSHEPDLQHDPPPPFFESHGPPRPPHFGPTGEDPEGFYHHSGVRHVSHESGPQYDPQPPLFEPHGPPRPSLYGEDPFQDPVNETPYGREGERYRPGYEEEGGSLNRQQTVRVFTKAEENYSLSIVHGKVVLTRKDPGDEFQHWIKDMRYGTKVKDEEGFPAFALVNKATGEAIKHSVGATHPVQLVPYSADYLDESILWTESRDLGDGFRCIRMVNNITLNFDAFHGDDDHGGVRDGTILVLWEWLKGSNQRWKIVPY